MAVDINNPNLGFFAHLEWVIELLAHGRVVGLDVYTACSSPNYTDPKRGLDFLSYFFDRKRLERTDAPLWRIRYIEEFGLVGNFDRDFTLHSAHDLFFDCYDYRPDFLLPAEEAIDELFEGHNVVGRHYRGTDKTYKSTGEAIAVQLEDVWTALDYELERMPADTRLFVATDQAHTLAAIRVRYGDRVVALDDSHRSDDDRPVHRNVENNGYKLGLDALRNCYALAMCDSVVKTSSILSAWAAVLNPNVRIHTLTRREAKFSFFPERDIPNHPTCSDFDANA